MVNAVFIGLTGLHPVLSVFFACIEGGLIGGIFGALIGAIKYDPNKVTYEPKKRKKSKKKDSEFDMDVEEEDEQFSFGTKTADGSKTFPCPFCGANLKEGLKYCMSCKNYL